MLGSTHLLRHLPGSWTLLLMMQVFSINAQSWQWVERIGGFGNEAFESLTTAADNRLYFAGSYEESFAPGGQSLPVYGGTDLFFAAVDESGVLQWTAAAGSTLDDAVAAMTVDEEGAVLCTGTFWQEAEFGEARIQAAANLKAIFLAKYENSGNLRWVRAIDGTMLKEVTDIATDQEGNIYLSGFFRGQLLIDSTVLVAKGTSDLFLLKFDSGGQLRWATSDGYSGDTRAIRMALSGEEIILGGFFNDTTLIAGERLTANTFDRDVFLACYDRLGQAKWARKAGGVHDDEITGLAVAADGDIFLAGFLVGVMKLSDDLSIQSKTGQSDFYLLRYSAGGDPLMGRAMGGDRLQQASDLAVVDDGVVVSGLYQGEMTIDGISVSAGSGFGSFIGHFDESGNLNWIKNLPTADGAFITHLEVDNQGDLLAGGAFRGDIAFDDITFSAGAQFDLFLGKLVRSATAVDRPEPMNTLRVYPNPADHQIILEGTSYEFRVTLFDSSGRWIWGARNTMRLDVSHLPAGVYTLVYTDEQKSEVAKIVIR